MSMLPILLLHLLTSSSLGLYDLQSFVNALQQMISLRVVLCNAGCSSVAALLVTELLKHSQRGILAATAIDHKTNPFAQLVSYVLPFLLFADATFLEWPHCHHFLEQCYFVLRMETLAPWLIGARSDSQWSGLYEGKQRRDM
jgi:hypothetical protein